MTAFIKKAGDTRMAFVGKSGIIPAVVAVLLNMIPAAEGKELQTDEAHRALRIETGDMHSAPSFGLAVSLDGKMVATGSNDRTVRIWALPGLRLLRKIFLPVGSPNQDYQGGIYTVAFSPDGTTIAASGWTGSWDRDDGPWCVYIIDVATGRIQRTVCDLPRRANHLAYSYDGNYLAVALKIGGGLRIYRTSDYTLAAEDRDYGETCTWVEFDRSGRLATTSYDGMVRLYDAHFLRIKSQAMPESRQPDSLSFSSDGKQIAVGYLGSQAPNLRWSPAVDVISAEDLSVTFRPDLDGVDNGALWRVAWSFDGNSLYATGTWRRGGSYPIRRWSNGGRGRPHDIAGSASQTVRLLALPTGGIVFVGEAPFIGVIAADEQLAAQSSFPMADFTDIGETLAVARDGYTVQFSFAPSGQDPAYVSLLRQTLVQGRAPDKEQLTHPITDLPTLDIRGWARGDRPTLNGTPLKMPRPYEQALSLAIAPDGSSFVLGTVWNLIRYDPSGHIVWSRPVPFNAHGVVVTADGRLVVAAIGDGTIRWYAMDDGRELLSFFPNRIDRRWVAWTQKGYYMASVGGENLIGWQVNTMPDQAADFFTAQRFRSRFYRPYVVQQVLASLDEDRAVAAADRLAGVQGKEPDFQNLLPPVIEIVSHKDADPFTSSKIILRYTVRSPIGENITDIDVYIDDAKLAESAPIPAIADGNDTRSFELALPPHDVTLALVARSGEKTSEPRVVRLVWGGPPPAVSEPKERLLALLVGVSDYNNQEKLDKIGLEKLDFADRDASNLAAALDHQKSKAFSEVETKVLPNADATQIRDGLNWLAKAAREREKSKTLMGRDITMIFLAGHGKTENNVFFFLPTNADPDNLYSTAITGAEIVAVLSGLPGLKLVAIDACHAGAGVMQDGRANVPVEMIRLTNDMTNYRGVVFFGSSSERQSSYEDKKLKDGVFTAVLVDGLSQADFDGNSKVETWELESWLKNGVGKLTKNEQTPLRYTSPPGLDFTISQY
jgi:hypothetical protein